MISGIDFAQKLSQAYIQAKKPLCSELELPQTAFDILLFLYNNPDYKTARDIVAFRKLKANLVSVNVARLEQEGYLLRSGVADDRRKNELHLTEKGASVAARGRELQKQFGDMLLQGLDEESLKILFHALAVIDLNVNEFLKGCT